MSDDPIRELLAAVAQQTMGLRPGWVAAPFGHVEAHAVERKMELGDDLELVREWVEANRGFVDVPPEPELRTLRANRTFAPATSTDRRRFVMPATALDDEPPGSP